MTVYFLTDHGEFKQCTIEKKDLPYFISIGAMRSKKDFQRFETINPDKGDGKPGSALWFKRHNDYFNNLVGVLSYGLNFFANQKLDINGPLANVKERMLNIMEGVENEKSRRNRRNDKN